MTTIQKVLLGLVVIAVASLTIYILIRSDSVEPEEQVACTMEALVCPDGSSVGRAGPECRFAACPDLPELVGTLRQNEQGFSLVLDADPSGAGMVYAVPLKLVVTNALQDFVDTRVKVYGGFNEGNTLSVERLVAASGSGAEAPIAASGEAAIGIGETKEVGGVRITLHEVVGDYRCPVDAQCIQAGAITARVTFEQGDTKEEFNMPSDEAPRPFGSAQVSITEVAPPLRSDEAADPSAYIVTFKVEPQ